jgi:hypothetical protein
MAHERKTWCAGGAWHMGTRFGAATGKQ